MLISFKDVGFICLARNHEQKQEHDRKFENKKVKIFHDLIFDHFQILAFSQLTTNTTLEHPFKASSKETSS